MMAVGIVLVLGFASLVVDIGSALVTKAELQNVSDAGVLAGTRELALIYRGLGSTTNYKTYTLTSEDKERILAKASQFAAYNRAAGAYVSVLPGDEVHGTYDTATGEIEPTDTGVRAVSLVSRRDESANGEVPMMLARVIGIDSLSITAQSAAALTPLGSLAAGEGEIPVGISSHWFETHACGPDSEMKFYPTNVPDSCAGWHTFTDFPANAAALKSILNGLEDGSYTSPETTAGETDYNFIGGAVASRFEDMKDLYDEKKDADGNWSVTLPVYESATCDNPSGPLTVIGFATARIFGVTTAPDKTISANIECGIHDSKAGHGPNDYGTLVGIPAMIQ